MARPTSGERMLDPLPGTTGAKARLAAIIATVSGEKSIPEVCGELGIGEARFHEMRKDFLAQALELLEKKTAGRKPLMDGTSQEIARLEEEVETLEVELEAARIRTEIALTMPHLLKNHLDKEREAREAAEAAGTAASAEAGMGMGLPERGKAGKKKRRQ